MSVQERSFGSDFKKFFGRGLAILLPSVLTLLILWHLFMFVYSNVGKPINRGVQLIVLEVTPRIVPDERLPGWFTPGREDLERHAAWRERNDLRPLEGAALRREVRKRQLNRFWSQHWYLEATGLFVAILLIYLVGLLLGNFLGRRMYSRLEAMLSRVPGFKQLYPHMKQLVDLIMGERPMAFNRAVLVQYSREGLWTVGLVTGNSMQYIRDEAGGECLSVFVPSTPTPFTGFTITVRKDEAVELPITIDQAIRFIITGGALTPDEQRVMGRDVALPDARTGRFEREVRPAETEGGDAPGDRRE